MKRYIDLLFIVTVLSLFSACRIETASNQDATQTDADTVATPVDSTTTGRPVPTALPYTTEYNSETDQFEIKENQVSGIPATRENMAQALNSKYTDIQIEVNTMRMSNDTLYVKIPDASYLTQNIGTTGATSYLVEATYAFTSIPNIHVVNFSFEEGDHAVPGPYTRASFHQFLK